MMNFDGQDMAKEFEKAFGKPISDCTIEQLWWLTKFAKHVRGRCRNNAALNNYMSRNFKARFREVEKTSGDGIKTYEGLEITK